MILDSVNIEICRQLRDGRKPYSQIADNLGITENTVRSRVNKMMEEKLLDIRGCIVPEAVPEGSQVIIGVKLHSMDLVSKGKEFSELKGVVSVAVVTGRYDLIVTVFLKEGFGLLEFYTDEVAKIQDVQAVETFVVYKGYNTYLPYSFEKENHE